MNRSERLFFLGAMLGQIVPAGLILAARPVAAGSQYFVWTANSQDLVPLKADVPAIQSKTDGPNAVRLELFRGEVEAFQVVLTSTESATPTHHVHLEYSPLVHRDDPNSTLAPANLQWFRVGYVNGRHADVLMPAEDFAVSESDGTNYPIWVRLKVPRDTKPGEYRGTIVLKAQSGVIAEIPLLARVWQTALPRQGQFNTAEFGFWEMHIAYQMGMPERYASPEMRDLLTRGAQMLADHRIVHGNDYVGPVPYRLTKDYFLTPEGQQEVVRWCEFWTSHGLRLSSGFDILDMNRTEERDDYARRFWQVYGPILREHGWDKAVYAKLGDEWHGEEQARRFVAAAMFLRSLMPTLQFATTSVGTRGRTENQILQDFKIAAKATTIWGQSFRSHIGPFTFDWPSQPKWPRSKGDRKRLREFLLSQPAKGCHVWPYIHDNLHLGRDGYGIRSFFWQLAAYGFDGCWLYSVTAWGQDKDSQIVANRNGITQKKIYEAGSGVLFWPGDQRLLESVRLEHVRDGIEDWELFRLLSERLKCAEKDRQKNKLWISQGRAALQLRNEQVNGRVNENGTFEHKTDPKSFARARRALAKALDSWPMPDEE